jgi:hypothetical protein
MLRSGGKMTVTLEKLPNEPIVMATLSGEVTIAEMEDMYAQCAQIIKEIGHIYRVTHLDNPTTGFMDILKILQAAGKGMPGSSSDPNVGVIFLGSGSLIQLITNTMRQPQFAGVQFPIFQSMEDTLIYIRYDMDKRRTKEMNKQAEESKSTPPQ